MCFWDKNVLLVPLNLGVNKNDEEEGVVEVGKNYIPIISIVNSDESLTNSAI